MSNVLVVLSLTHVNIQDYRRIHMIASKARKFNGITVASKLPSSTARTSRKLTLKFMMSFQFGQIIH